ncbi:MAG: N-acetyltransferase [Acidimicrobiia bacterium]|nr:N-acetyltransferase [Acidimicrobiia bacterium]
MAFVPDDFTVPQGLEGPGFRLEPLGPQHNERDHAAWMSSVGHIRATPGFPNGTWPSPMSLEENLADLERHADDFATRRGFTYSVVDGDAVIGCVYVYPSDHPDHDAEVRSWVTAERAAVDGPVRRVVADWLATSWPFAAPRYEGPGV